jgi:hypothetical protein
VLDHGGGGVLLGKVEATGYRPELRAGYGLVQFLALLSGIRQSSSLHTIITGRSMRA